MGFEGPDGSSLDHWPTLIASDGDRLAFGPHALAWAAEGWAVYRDLKRDLGAGRASVSIGGTSRSVVSLLGAYVAALAHALRTASSCPLPGGADEPLHVMLAVPAGASSAQRMHTFDAFVAAGFLVEGLLNEPSAAGLEYADRYPKTVTSNREDVLIYDFGGGTFDVSLVRMGGGTHAVRDHAGDNRLGGADFDAVLLKLALDEAGVDATGWSVDDRAAALERARQAKESIHANTRRVSVEVADAVVSLPVSALYTAVAPLLAQALDTVRRVLPEGSADGLAGVYVVGGASELPIVARGLREVFGRRVKRSPYASAATAVGLAIATDRGAPAVAERFSRTFGVFRERDGGAGVVFDPILSPGASAVELRRYRAAHNVGVYRFAECERVVGAEPVGGLTPWEPVRVPFLPGLPADLSGVSPQRLSEPGPEIEERYSVGPDGIVEVTIANLGSGRAVSRRFAADAPGG